MSAPNRRVTVERVDWSQAFLFTHLPRAFALAVQPNRLLMAMMLVVICMISGSLWDGIASGLSSSDEASAAAMAPGAFEMVAQSYAWTSNAMVEATLRGDLVDAVRVVSNMPCKLFPMLFDQHPAFTIIFGLWILILWAIGGGMIARSVACEFAIDQFIPWPEALAFALKRWVSLIGAFLMPIGAVVAGIFLLALGGLLFRVPGLNILGGIIYGVALFGGFLAAAVIILTWLASGLFVPAVAVESADAPDALARGFSYVKNRPILFVTYVLIAWAIGWAGYLIVLAVASLTINFTAAGASFFGGEALETFAGNASMTSIFAPEIPEEITGTDRVAFTIVSFWRTVIGSIVIAFLVSYKISALTVIYFLMRKATDDQDIEEIWLPGMIEGTLAPDRAVKPE